MTWLSAASLVITIQVVCGCVAIALALFQLILVGKTYAFLRSITYAAFTLTLVGVVFGKYYASTAPRRLKPIEKRAPVDAIVGYTEAIRLNPINADLYFRRGRTEFQLNQYADAIRDFNKTLDLSPNDPQYLANRGFASWFAGDHRSAKNDILQALAYGSQEPEVQMAHGLILEYDDQFQQAINEYTTALSRSDLDASSRCATLTNRGNSYRALKLFTEAEADDNNVVASCQGPWREDALVHRGIDRWQTGDHAAALADWEEALRLDPNGPVVFENRAELYTDENRLGLALADYNRYLQIRPDDAFTHLVRAGVYRRLGDLSSAQADEETGKYLDRTNHGKSYGPKLFAPR